MSLKCRMKADNFDSPLHKYQLNVYPVRLKGRRVAIEVLSYEAAISKSAVGIHFAKSTYISFNLEAVYDLSLNVTAAMESSRIG